MARTTRAAVELIISTSEADAVIDAFIETANLWVTTFLEGACDSAKLTTAVLTEVEKWLASAMLQARDPALLSATLDDVTEKYQRDPKVSEYLRTAMAFDPCGVLERHFLEQEKTRRVKFRVGEGFDDQLDLPTDET